jgi:hypothetical protein
VVAQQFRLLLSMLSILLVFFYPVVTPLPTSYFSIIVAFTLASNMLSIIMFASIVSLK